MNIGIVQIRGVLLNFFLGENNLFYISQTLHRISKTTPGHHKKKNQQYTYVCKFLSCHEHVSEWIHRLYLPECQGTPCSKQAWIKGLQQNLNPEPFSSYTNAQPLGQTCQMIEMVVSIYLFGAFDCMFLSCHICISQWIHILYLPEC